MAALARALAPTTDLTDSMFDELAAELVVRQAEELAIAASRPTDEELDRATDHTGETAHRIANARATSLAGFKAKAQAVFWAAGGDDDSWRDHQRHHGDGTAGQFAFSIINDLLALPTATVHPFPPLAAVEPVETASEIKRTATEFVACLTQADEIGRRLDAAMSAAEAMYPEVPDAIRDPQNPGRPLHRLALEQMDKTERGWSNTTPQGSPRVEAVEKWYELRDLIDGSFGVPGLNDSWEQARGIADGAGERIVGLRPATIQEAFTKYAVLLASYVDASNSQDVIATRPFLIFLRDLEHLAANG